MYFTRVYRTDTIFLIVKKFLNLLNITKFHRETTTITQNSVKI